MRIITGQLRGRILQTLEGEDTRPTAQRVKEGLFSAIQFDIEGRKVLDLFAGSGQLGIEALSRGAANCVFVDRNPEAAAVIRRNLTENGLAAVSRVLTQDAASYLAHLREAFDLVFLDPPYAAGLLEPTLQAVAPHLAEGGIVVCESDRELDMPDRAGALGLYRSYRYGRVVIWLYRWNMEEGVAL